MRIILSDQSNSFDWTIKKMVERLHEDFRNSLITFMNGNIEDLIIVNIYFEVQDLFAFIRE